MSAERNKALVSRLFELFDQHAVDSLGEVLADDYVHHDPALPLPGTGLASYQQAVKAHFTAFPDARMTLDAAFAEGDRVGLRWTLRGTHTGPLMDIPPTGREVNISAIQISRLAGGKIVEGWVNYDALGMMQQLGVIPTPGQETA